MSALCHPKPERRAPKPRRRIERAQRPRRRRKTRRAELMQLADQLAREIVMRRGVCEVDGCGATTGLQWAHGFRRGYLKTRWLDWGNFCLCAHHHLYYTHRPEEWGFWMLRKLGEATLTRLHTLALDHAPLSVVDMEGVVEELRRQGGGQG